MFFPWLSLEPPPFPWTTLYCIASTNGRFYSRFDSRSVTLLMQQAGRQKTNQTSQVSQYFPNKQISFNIVYWQRVWWYQNIHMNQNISLTSCWLLSTSLPQTPEEESSLGYSPMCPEQCSVVWNKRCITSWRTRCNQLFPENQTNKYASKGAALATIFVSWICKG